MIVTTTGFIDGKEVSEYLGIVSGEAIVGAHLFKDLFASIRDIVGGRSAAYEDTMKEAKAIALRELKDEALQLHADAVVGISLDYEVMGKGNGMMMVSATGTAVKLRRKSIPEL